MTMTMSMKRDRHASLEAHCLIHYVERHVD